MLCISNVHCAAADDVVTASVHDNLHINDVSPADVCQTAVADAHLMFDCEPCLSDASVSHSIASLSYIDVCIDGVNDVVRGLHDSGVQISVIHPRIVEGLNLPREGTIKLNSLFGDAVDADLVSLFVRLPQGTGIPVLMAMSSQVNNDLILTKPVVKSLFTAELPVYANECEADIDDHDDRDDHDDHDDDLSIHTYDEMKPD